MAELRRAAGHTQASFAERLGVATKYYQRIERGLENLTLQTMERLAGALGVDLAALLERAEPVIPRRGRPKRAEVGPGAPAHRGGAPFRVLSLGVPDERAVRAVPLVSLSAAAGSFRPALAVEVTAWVVPRTGRTLEPGMFVARVVGSSMEPLIPSGAFCLFGEPRDVGRGGQIALVEHRGRLDPDTGASYGVKRVRVEAFAAPRRRSRAPGRRIQLVSVNPAFPPVVLATHERGEQVVRVVARLVEVLGVEPVDPRDT
ncbi:MAG: helix-turn-helix transcriptional regulator [Myxococcales bacterium]|nr:helix-turn-helix transcriptional regulator [Myxococcales bacterium]